MRSLLRQVVLVSSVLLLAAASSSGLDPSARIDDPFAGLPSKVVAQLKKNLSGVVIESREDVPPLKKAEDWLPLSQAEFEFERAGSRNKSIRWAITPAKKVPGEKETVRGWTIVDSDGTTRFLSLTEAGVIQSRFTVSHPNGFLIKFDPPEPVVHPAGPELEPTEISISVSDLDSPSDVKYSGKAKCTWRDLGGFRVKVPAGEYDARLLWVHYDGSVGPASVDGSQLLFVSPGTGPVAFTDDRAISAFLFINDDTARAGVLRKVSRGG
ncbi:MAG: hypothetical protein GY895_14655 [Phycisphaera sp.]|nr:hypothetical protein [Phycisphaera sp.]